MNTTKKKSIVGILVGAAALGLYAGNLEPPGPPGPTMKNLDTVEPRTPIRAADLPLTISVPGSYYAVEDLASGGNITIDSECVTLDLNGFALFGGGTGSSGIVATAAANNLEVKNGVVAGWGQDGLDLTAALHARVVDLRVEGNAGYGIHLGRWAQVMDTIASNNQLSGIRSVSEVLVVRTSAYQNGQNGIEVGGGSLVTHCNARENSGNGFQADRATINESEAYSNLGAGIRVSTQSTVQSCKSGGNLGHGIHVVSANNSIVGNMVTANSPAGVNSGIYVDGPGGTRVEGNNVTGHSGNGIEVIIGGHLIIKNSAADNGTDYALSGINTVGQIVTATGTISADPWANFSY